ncbi:ribose ABC transporter permease [soil metagenome]
MTAGLTRMLRGRLTVSYLIVIALIVILLATGGLISDRFLSVRNFSNLAQQMAVLGVVSLGQTVVILTGGIDLSNGTLISSATVFFANFLEWRPELIWLAIVLALAGSTIVGAVNGLLVVGLRIHPLIVTLGMSSILYGATLLYRKEPGGTVPDSIQNLAFGRIFGIPIPALILIAVFSIAGLWLQRFRSGRAVYFVGGNPESARLNGLSVGRVVVYVYAISGLCAGLAAILLAARTGVGDPRIGASMTLSSITPVVVGGTILAGGRGGVFGTLLGVFLVSLLNNVLNYMNVSSYYQWIIQGLIILTAVGLHTGLRRDGRHGA